MEEAAPFVPAAFARAMDELYGEEGVAWLESLPDLLDDCARRWSLQVGPPFEPLSYNYVAPASRADGTRAVLKVGFPNRELLTEMEALRLYAGRGCVQLLEADPERAAFLLERIEPGTTHSRIGDDALMTTIAAELMCRLWRPVPAEHPFPTVADWAAGLDRLRQEFNGGTGPLPSALVAEAEALFAELLPSQAELVLLHGDLHHDNILAASREPWLAIDPKGVVGEPAYEVGALLRNGWRQDPDPWRLQARRIAMLAEALGLDRERLRAWGVAQAVLSAWWSLEDHGHGWEEAIACAEILSAARL